jgi:hypothetical protein
MTLRPNQKAKTINFNEIKSLLLSVDSKEN